jgi:DNA-binding NtrC family response regulator
MMAEKILLVDDEQDFLETLSQRIIMRGIDVSATTSAKEAIAKVTAESFEAIILDLQMPEMDGLEVLRTIKKLKPDMQIIVLTGHATVKKAIEAMKLGALDLIEKPADLDTIMEKIKKAHVKKLILVEKETEKKVKNIMSRKGW